MFTKKQHTFVTERERFKLIAKWIVDRYPEKNIHCFNVLGYINLYPNKKWIPKTLCIDDLAQFSIFIEEIKESRKK